MKAEVQKRIDELKAQVNELELELQKPEKWQPKGGEYWYSSANDVVQQYSSTKPSREMGLERDTEEQMKTAVKEIRAFARLLAYRDEFDTVDPSYREHYISVDCWGDFNYFKCSKTNINTGRVIFSLDVAKELVRKLKSGEVEL